MWFCFMAQTGGPSWQRDEQSQVESGVGIFLWDSGCVTLSHTLHEHKSHQLNTEARPP